MLKDKDIREPLFEYLENRFGKIRIFEEKNMGDSRADIVMVGENYVAGIEIKSDADTYSRLERQVKDYDIYFDFNYVVVGSSHAKNVSKYVPEHWGILSVEIIDGAFDVYTIREAAKNPNCVMLRKIRMLWRPELAHIQQICELPAYKAKSKDFVREMLTDRVETEKLNKLISDELFERDYTTIGDEIMSYRKAQNPGKRIRRKRVKRKRRV